jgi:hypothetical protein
MLLEGQIKVKLQFFLQGPPRYSDLLSDYPMTTIDCEFTWADSEGNTYAIYLNVNDNATMKLQFVKRILIRLNGFFDLIFILYFLINKCL